MMRELEVRATRRPVEVRAATDAAGPGIVGRAIVYGAYSRNLGGFVEMVEPGFVRQTITDGADVMCRLEHDTSRLLGRTMSGTLRLDDNDEGLDYDVDVPDTTYGRDLLVSAGRGDIPYSSFAFRLMPDGDRWDLTEQGTPLRILQRGGGKLVDVATVADPAYPDSTSGLRSLAEQRGLDLDVVRAAASAHQLGDLMRSGAPVVIDLGAGGPGPTHPPVSVLRRRLDLRAREYDT